jgi:hypothetical protein
VAGDVLECCRHMEPLCAVLATPGHETELKDLLALLRRWRGAFAHHQDR